MLRDIDIENDNLKGSADRRFVRALAALGPVALVLAAVSAIAPTSAAAARQGGTRPPEVVQLSYAETHDGSSQRYLLEAYVRRTDSLTFSTSYHGKRATADAHYDPNITDTDIRAEQASHPWVLSHTGSRRRVRRLIRASLKARGGGGRRSASASSVAI